MAFCPNCGHETTPGARFCEYCGTQLSVLEQAPVVQPVVTAQPTVVQPIIAQTVTPVQTVAARDDDYTVFLVSTSTCPANMAAELLADACGYSDADAFAIVRNCPTPVAQNLTERQATYLAHAMAEYGMDVSIYNSYGYQNIQANVTTVFRQDGGFLAKAAQVIGLIGAVNRLTPSMMHRYDYPFGGIRPVLYPRPRVLNRPARRPSLRMQTLHRAVMPTPPKPELRVGPKAAAKPRVAAPKAAAKAPKASAAPGRAPGSKKGPGGMGPGGRR